MTDIINPANQSNASGEKILAEAVATILEANGLGERSNMTPSTVIECAKDAGDNVLVRADVGTRRFFLTLSPAHKGRLVGEDSIDDPEVQRHFSVNIIGEAVKP